MKKGLMKKLVFIGVAVVVVAAAAVTTIALLNKKGKSVYYDNEMML